LDKSLRDGDLVSLEGFSVEPSLDDLPPQDLLDIVDSIDIDIPADFGAIPSPDNLSISSADPLAVALAAPPTASGVIASSNSRKSKRGRSLSSKFWLVNKLAASGKIT
jgi:hypothetical protein